MAMPQQKEACVWGAGAGREKRRTREREWREGALLSHHAHSLSLTRKRKRGNQVRGPETDSDCLLGAVLTPKM